jgi:hypothetical protein
VYVALIFVALFLVDVCGLKKVQKIKSSSLKSTLQLPFLSPPLILQPTFPLFRFLSARNRNRTPARFLSLSLFLPTAQFGVTVGLEIYRAWLSSLRLDSLWLSSF